VFKACGRVFVQGLPLPFWAIDAQCHHIEKVVSQTCSSTGDQGAA
jgi:hypothetical protein